MKTKRTHIRIAAVVLAMMLVLPLSVSTVAPAYASEVENQTEEAVVTDDVKAEATEEKEIAVNGSADPGKHRAGCRCSPAGQSRG